MERDPSTGEWRLAVGGDEAGSSALALLSDEDRAPLAVQRGGFLGVAESEPSLLMHSAAGPRTCAPVRRRRLLMRMRARARMWRPSARGSLGARGARVARMRSRLGSSRVDDGFRRAGCSRRAHRGQLSRRSFGGHHRGSERWALSYVVLYCVVL